MCKGADDFEIPNVFADFIVFYYYVKVSFSFLYSDCPFCYQFYYFFVTYKSKIVSEIIFSKFLKFDVDIQLFSFFFGSSMPASHRHRYAFSYWVKKIDQLSAGLSLRCYIVSATYSPPVVSVSTGASSCVGRRLSFSNDGVITCLAAFSMFGEEN